MDSIGMQLTESVFRWFHVVTGILWIGILYFFNWINGPFVATLDAETKKKVVPELMPRALFFFRYAALITWVTGLGLLSMVYYMEHGMVLLNPGATWTIGTTVSVLSIFVAPFIYDALANAVPNQLVMATVGLALISAVDKIFMQWGNFSYRGIVIHIGAMFGTIMAYNVWFRIWPNQKAIITAVKNGTPPDAKLVANAGLRSKHNTFMSVPLVWAMLNAHHPFSLNTQACSIVLVAAISWFFVPHIYKRAGKVKGF